MTFIAGWNIWHCSGTEGVLPFGPIWYMILSYYYTPQPCPLKMYRFHFLKLIYDDKILYLSTPSTWSWRFTLVVSSIIVPCTPLFDDSAKSIVGVKLSMEQDQYLNRSLGWTIWHWFSVNYSRSNLESTRPCRTFLTFNATVAKI